MPRATAGCNRADLLCLCGWAGVLCHAWLESVGDRMLRSGAGRAVEMDVPTLLRLFLLDHCFLQDGESEEEAPGQALVAKCTGGGGGGGMVNVDGEVALIVLRASGGTCRFTYGAAGMTGALARGGLAVRRSSRCGGPAPSLPATLAAPPRVGVMCV